MQQLTDASNHNSRLSKPANANPARAHLNRGEFYGDAKNALEAFEKLKEDLNFSGRQNSVVGREFLLTFSPEMKNKVPLDDWVEANKAWLEKRYGEHSKAGRLISFELHLDESTPHIHAIVVPVVEKKYYGKLQWRLDEKFVHGDSKRHKAAAKMSALQDDYARAMSQFGLKRGLRGSGAKHKTIKKYYSELEKNVSYIEKELLDKKKIVDAEADKIEKSRFMSLKSMKKKAKELMDFIKKLLDQNALYKAENAKNHAEFSEKVERLRTQNKIYKNALKQMKKAVGGNFKVSEAVELLHLGRNEKAKREQKKVEKLIDDYSPEKAKSAGKSPSLLDEAKPKSPAQETKMDGFGY